MTQSYTLHHIETTREIYATNRRRRQHDNANETKESSGNEIDCFMVRVNPRQLLVVIE